MASVLYAADRFKGKDADARVVLARVQDSKTACMKMHEQWMYDIAFVRGGKNQWAYREAMTGRIQELPAVPWRTRLTDNQTRPLLTHMVALLVEKQPTWTALARSSEEEDMLAGRGYEALLQYDWDRLELTDWLKEILGWMTRIGNGIARVSWNPSAGIPVGVPLLVGSDVQGKGSPKAEGKDEPTPDEEQFYVPGSQGQEPGAEGMGAPAPPGGTDFDAMVYEGDIDVRAVSPFNFGVDLQADRLSRAAHCWQEAFVHRDVLVDRIGSRALRIVPDVSVDEFRNYEARLRFEQGGQDFVSDGSEDMVRVVECWEAPSKRHPQGRVITVAGGETLGPPRDNPYGGRYPFVHFRCYEVLGSFWADGVVPDLVPLQQGLNQAKSRYHDIMKLVANPKAVTDSPLKETSYNDQPGEIIKIKRGSMFQFMTAPIPPSIHMQIIADNANSMQTVTGVNDPLAGNNPANVRSMGALNALQSAGMRSFTPLALNVELGLRQAGKLLLYLHKRFYTEDRTFQVVGRDGRAEVFHMKKADVERIVDVTITHGSLLPKLPGAQQEAAMQIIQYAPFLFAGEDGQIDAEHIFGILDMPTAQGGVSLKKRQRMRAFRENVDAELGKPLKVLPFDDDTLHMRIIAARLSDDEWVEAHERAAGDLMEHYAAHEMQKQKKTMGLMADVHAPGPMSGPPPGIQTGSRPKDGKPGEGGPTPPPPGNPSGGGAPPAPGPGGAGGAP